MAYSSNQTFARPEPTSHFTCGIAVIMKRGKTSGIYPVVFNAKLQPNRNFYILPSDKQQRWRWLQAISQAQQRLSSCICC